MKLSHVGRSAAVLAIGALALTACGSDNPTGNAGGGSGEQSGVSGTLTGIGASSQQAAMTAWQNGFQSANSGATVQYSPDGSGAGRKAFLAGGANFAGSDAYLTEDEVSQAKQQCGDAGAMDLPVYVSPISVAFNLPGVKSLNLDAPTIAKIFKGEIKKWNADEIKKQNPDADLPDTAVTVVHRSDDSGTTENFTDYLSKAAPQDWTEEPAQAWPTKYAAENNKGTSGVVSTTSSTEGAVTYADSSAVGDLGTAAIKVGEKYVAHSADAAAKAVEVSKQVEGRGEHDMAIDIDRATTEAGAYPLVLISYHVVCSTYDSRETADLVKSFEKYVVSEDGQKAAADSAGSAPLSQSLREDATAAVESISAKG
ncbi:MULTISPECIES: phosphate ABC transporter substrate-binding protein PstS [Kocuria]|uniref:phosphate ABC transporter substrate-binding protein PstS n=1 Tax=Kocuria TaxID=57493 RepID=UPI0018DCE5F3|nr:MULTISPECIES: phosphate ABC transporter substrate-binding protein PstS [Kocuria]MDN5631698.1 phosphate ABC transporter substrate-binding protein PstS [Kocuria sp.]